MARQSPRLTPAVQQAITAYIRAGGFPHVAAEAAGVPRAVFQRWLRRGQEAGARRAYRQFAAAVRQALAQARLGAEIAVLKNRPLDWLKCGPGREAPGSPGWTGTVKAPAAAGPRANPLLRPEMQELLAGLLQALSPFPEARAAAAATLALQTGEPAGGPPENGTDRPP
jgi:hypothetical protein